LLANGRGGVWPHPQPFQPVASCLRYTRYLPHRLRGAAPGRTRKPSGKPFAGGGDEAYVRHRTFDPLLPEQPAYAVGRQQYSLFEVRSQGDSWEEAFHDADAHDY
jgi:hypothetical protein